jgi:hypothetical protein
LAVTSRPKKVKRGLFAVVRTCAAAVEPAQSQLVRRDMVRDREYVMAGQKRVPFSSPKISREVTRPSWLEVSAAGVKKTCPLRRYFYCL